MKGRIFLFLGLMLGIVACALTCTASAAPKPKSPVIEHLLTVCPVMTADVLSDQHASLVVAVSTGTPCEGYTSVLERPPAVSSIPDNKYVRWRISYLRLGDTYYSYLRYTEHLACFSGGNPYWCRNLKS